MAASVIFPVPQIKVFCIPGTSLTANVPVLYKQLSGRSSINLAENPQQMSEELWEWAKTKPGITCINCQLTTTRAPVNPLCFTIFTNFSDWATIDRNKLFNLSLACRQQPHNWLISTRKIVYKPVGVKSIVNSAGFYFRPILRLCLCVSLSHKHFKLKIVIHNNELSLLLNSLFCIWLGHKRSPCKRTSSIHERVGRNLLLVVYHFFQHCCSLKAEHVAFHFPSHFTYLHQIDWRPPWRKAIIISLLFERLPSTFTKSPRLEFKVIGVSFSRILVPSVWYGM